MTGNIVLGYSMDTTTYFPTLDQYKVNPANVIQSEVSTPVSAPADARVVSVGTNEEIGNYVDLDLGNGYTAVCGQLKEIPVVENEYVRQGDLLGYVAEPTKYYAVEGTNVFFWSERSRFHVICKVKPKSLQGSSLEVFLYIRKFQEIPCCIKGTNVPKMHILISEQIKETSAYELQKFRSAGYRYGSVLRLRQKSV